MSHRSGWAEHNAKRGLEKLDYQERVTKSECARINCVLNEIAGRDIAYREDFRVGPSSSLPTKPGQRLVEPGFGLGGFGRERMLLRLVRYAV